MRAVLHWLDMRGIFAWRNNTGVYPETRGGVKRWIAYGCKGSPDIITVYRGRFVGLETKTQKGAQSDDQKAFQAKLEKAGGIYVLLRPDTYPQQLERAFA